MSLLACRIRFMDRVVRKRNTPCRASLQERFWPKVDKNAEGGCWEWTASVMAAGYGQINLGRRGDGIGYAHRLAYEWLVGPIPPDLVIDHVCRNRRCVNPAHLEVVTERENILRGAGGSAINALKTHCVNGHEFTPENTYVYSMTGARSCRECARARDRRRQPRIRRMAGPGP